jgi:hypothetical protein
MRIQLVAQLLISAYRMLGCGLIPYLSQSHVWLLPNSLSRLIAAWLWPDSLSQPIACLAVA